MEKFAVAAAIRRTSEPLVSLGVSEVRLQSDARWPWLVLIPRRAGARELEHLSVADRAALMEECMLAGAAVRAIGGALGRPVVGADGSAVATDVETQVQGGILVPGYTASKHAVAGLTKAFANELAARGVNVNAIAPGYMATDNTAQLRADEARERSIADRIPAGRWGTPADLQGAFVFLASAASDYLNGAIIPVDGGWLVR